MRILRRHRAETTVSAYGVNVRLSLPDAEMLNGVVAGLPPSWITGAPSPGVIAASFTVTREPGRYLIRADRLETHYADREVATFMLGRMLRQAVASGIQNETCIHASVVTYDGRAIMVPARAFAGTTTLVTALVAAGAQLYSDELTLIDADGGLLSGLERLPGTPVPAVTLRLVAVTVYRPGTSWAPKRLSPAAGVVSLMAYAANRKRSAETLAALRLAMHDAYVLEGDRGEAGETAAALLETVNASSSG